MQDSQTDWPDIPDTPEQRKLIQELNAAFRKKYPNLREIEKPKTVGVTADDEDEANNLNRSIK